MQVLQLDQMLQILQPEVQTKPLIQTLMHRQGKMAQALQRLHCSKQVQAQLEMLRQIKGMILELHSSRMEYRDSQ